MKHFSWFTHFHAIPDIYDYIEAIYFILTTIMLSSYLVANMAKLHKANTSIIKEKMTQSNGL